MNIETLALSDLKPALYNPRQISDEAMKRLERSIEEFDLVEPIIVNKRTGYRIVGGHQRYKVMQKRGATQTECVVVDMPESREKALNVALNNQTMTGEYDFTKLADLLQEIDTGEFDMAITGFDEKELADIANWTPDPEGDEETDPIPDVEDASVSRLGDIWELGAHRVICGDATDKSVWEALDAPSQGLVVFTSPPYNLGGSIKLSGNKAKSAQGNAYESHQDSMDPSSWRTLLDGMLTCALDKAEAAVFNVQPLAGNKRVIWRWVADHDDHLSDVVMWDKGQAAPPMAAGVMASRYEWLCVFAKGKATRRIPLSSWRGTVQNVYHAPPQRNNEYAKIHGATFPVHLPKWVMSTLCNTSAAVLDCCLGTGTTIIAAEALGRRGYGIEIDPRYVDVAVKRWQNYTGKKARNLTREEVTID